MFQLTVSAMSHWLCCFGGCGEENITAGRVRCSGAKVLVGTRKRREGNKKELVFPGPLKTLSPYSAVS